MNRSSPRKSSKPYKSQLWALALLLILVVLLLVAIISKPAIVRWSHLRHLTDKDLAKREQALNYVVRFGKHDPAVIAGAIARLGIDDEENFRQIINAIANTGQWRRPVVPDGVWLRWVSDLVVADEKDARILAAHYLADSPDLVIHYPHPPGNTSSPVLTYLYRLTFDGEADVRYAALLATAELAGKLGESSGLTISLLQRETTDKDPEIARHAWIFLALSPDWKPEHAPDWRSAPPRVGEAMLWAYFHARRDQIKFAIDVLNDEKLPIPLRAMAAYSLNTEEPAAEYALMTFIKKTKARDITPAASVILWRAMLSVHRPLKLDLGPALMFFTLFSDWLDDALAGPSWNREDILPLVCAAIYRDGKLRTLPSTTTKPATQPDSHLPQNLADLAAMEGGPPFIKTFPPLNADTPDMLRLAIVTAMKDRKPEDLRPLFDSDEPTMRDLACVTAAVFFTKDQNAALVDSLLNDLNDEGKISGAVLAGLSGVRGDLLAKKMADENVWPVKQMMKLGLWMQGGMPEIARTAPELLVRTDIPKSTLVLVLMHQKNPAGLDYLFNPVGEPPLDLVELFDQKRWWRVLSKYLPEDAPPFFPWADPGLEQFQIDVLRDWYLVNREKLYPR